MRHCIDFGECGPDCGRPDYDPRELAETFVGRCTTCGDDIYEAFGLVDLCSCYDVPATDPERWAGGVVLVGAVELSS